MGFCSISLVRMMKLTKKRDYKKEYNDYHASDEQKKRRAARNNARRSALKTGAVHKGDNKEIDHKNFNPLDNSAKNKQVLSRKANRSKQPKHKGR